MERSHMIKIVLACILALVGIAVIVMTVKQYKKGSGFEEAQGMAYTSSRVILNSDGNEDRSGYGFGGQQRVVTRISTSSSAGNLGRKVVGTQHWNAYPQYTVDDVY